MVNNLINYKLKNLNKQPSSDATTTPVSNDNSLPVTTNTDSST